MEHLRFKCFAFFIFTFFIACFQTKEPALNRSSDFQDNGNGTITDLKTKLTWQKCSMGQKVNSQCDGDLQSTNWLIAMRYCEKLSLANQHWTLPTSQEILSLLSPESIHQVNSIVFPNNGKSNYWTSTSHETVDLIGIVLNMQEAKADYKVKFDMNTVRCIVKHKIKKKDGSHHHVTWKEED
jgi:hypothetical protein